MELLSLLVHRAYISHLGSIKGNMILYAVDLMINVMNAVFAGLTPGSHAIHLHEFSDCSSPDGKSTGGHWNPTFESHGAWGNETCFHRGDIGNFEANENGEATISFETDLWCINCDDETKNIVGKAVIVHQGQDDFVSQPSGAAGSRVSCAGLIQ